jgi:hypothetical protein
LSGHECSGHPKGAGWRRQRQLMTDPGEAGLSDAGPRMSGALSRRRCLRRPWTPWSRCGGPSRRTRRPRSPRISSCGGGARDSSWRAESRTAAWAGSPSWDPAPTPSSGGTWTGARWPRKGESRPIAAPHGRGSAAGGGASGLAGGRSPGRCLRAYSWGVGRWGFQGSWGAGGAFGYDLSRTLERLPSDLPDDTGFPAALFARYQTVLAFDHARQRMTAVSLLPAAADVPSRLEALRRAEGRIEGVLDALRRGRAPCGWSRELGAEADATASCRDPRRALPGASASGGATAQGRRTGLRTRLPGFGGGGGPADPGGGGHPGGPLPEAGAGLPW